MIAASDNGRTRRRTQRCGVEVDITQTVGCDPVESRGREYAAERARDAEACIVGHDQQDVWHVLGRHNAGWPVGRRLLDVTLDLAAELLRWGRKLPPIDRCRCAGRTGRAGDLLGIDRHNWR